MVVASYVPVTVREAGTAPPSESLGCACEGPVSILDERGQFLSQGLAEVTEDRWLVRGLNPSGAVATAYFGRQQRRFRLVLPDGSTRTAHMRSCSWQDGERVCELQVFPIQQEGDNRLHVWNESLVELDYVPAMDTQFSRN
jgi:hypothetical protein